MPGYSIHIHDSNLVHVDKVFILQIRHIQEPLVHLPALPLPSILDFSSLARLYFMLSDHGLINDLRGLTQCFTFLCVTLVEPIKVQVRNTRHPLVCPKTKENGNKRTYIAIIATSTNIIRFEIKPFRYSGAWSRE